MAGEVMSWLFDTMGPAAIAVAAAVVIFRRFGNGWLESRFKERLEAYKHEQDKQLEEYKSRVNSLFQRISKIQEREFEVLSEAWGKLNKAIRATRSFASLFESYPDIDSMVPERRSEFLKSTELSLCEKERIEKATDKSKEYYDIIFGYRSRDTRVQYWEFHDYIEANSIFMQSELKALFLQIDGILWHAIVARERSQAHDRFKLWSDAYNRITEEVLPLMGEIETLIQSRLKHDLAA